MERHQDSKQYDLIFGDAFNDFSVPWHLTTREFNEKIAKMMSPTGVYMINIIDVYESDATALEKAEKIIAGKKIAGLGRPGTDPPSRAGPRRRLRRHLGLGELAELTFPSLHIFGTDRSPGTGKRETFVVVASRQPLDLKDLALRATMTPSSITTITAPNRLPTAPRTRQPLTRAGPAHHPDG